MNSPRQSTALVTGGGGFLGYAIVLRLLKMKTRVRTFSRRNYKSLDIKDVEQYQGGS